MSQKAAPNSKLWRNMLVAFFNWRADLHHWAGNHELDAVPGLSREDGGAVTSISLIFLSALLTGLNCYDNIAKHAGAGTLVPITGFANAMSVRRWNLSGRGLHWASGQKCFPSPALLFCMEVPLRSSMG